MSEMRIYIDGRWVRRQDAKLSVFDHGVLYGDGVFEGIRAYGGFVFRLKEHLSRLARSARLVSLRLPLSVARLHGIVYEALRRNNLRDSYVRLLVTRGAGDLGLDPRACPKPSVVVIADKLALFPARCYAEGLSAIIAKTRRTPAEALNPTIKSMNYLNNILAKIEAVKKGVPEAIMLNAKGYVAECTGDNVFLIKGRTVVTPSVSAGVLEGVTRKAVLEIIRRQTPYRIKETLFRPAALFQADEMFFTGTAAEVIPVTRVDGRRIGSGKPGLVTRRLMSLFTDLIRRESSRSKKRGE